MPLAMRKCCYFPIQTAQKLKIKLPRRLISVNENRPGSPPKGAIIPKYTVSQRPGQVGHERSPCLGPVGVRVTEPLQAHSLSASVSMTERAVDAAEMAMSFAKPEGAPSIEELDNWATNLMGVGDGDGCRWPLHARLSTLASDGSLYLSLSLSLWRSVPLFCRCVWVYVAALLRNAATAQRICAASHAPLATLRYAARYSLCLPLPASLCLCAWVSVYDSTAQPSAIGLCRILSYRPAVA